MVVKCLVIAERPPFAHGLRHNLPAQAIYDGVSQNFLLLLNLSFLVCAHVLSRSSIHT